MEPNIQEFNRPVMRAAKAMAAEVSMDNLQAQAAPTFEAQEVQNLKTISIKEPMTIYPNFNKIKYLDKKYPVEQYANLGLDSKYEIYMGDETLEKDKPKDIKEVLTKGTALNIVYVLKE